MKNFVRNDQQILAGLHYVQDNRLIEHTVNDIDVVLNKCTKTPRFIQS
jgi:hypothetical protein